MWSKFSTDNIIQLGNDISWNYSSDELGSNQMWEELSSKLSQISEKVPKSKIKTSNNGDIISKLPWDCSSLKRRRKQKDASWSNFDNNPTAANLNIACHSREVNPMQPANRVKSDIIWELRSYTLN